jgi:CobQ-like glutamine amidotransferase family enzyme
VADRTARDPVRIALVFPSLLGTYGDGGNASVLAQRLRWRGYDAETIDVGVDDPLPAQCDLYVLGGGEDAAQALAVSRLADGTLARAAEAGASVFAVCAGFQILGATWLDGTGRVAPGLGLIDAHTDRLPGTRAVGELLTEPVVDGLEGPLTGYENHGGRTRLGAAARPLGRVLAGVGNGDTVERGPSDGPADVGVDGAVQGTVVATYLHGPALARNPALADWLLTRVVGGPLPPLDDSEEEELRRERIAAVRRGRLARWRRQYRPPAKDPAAS